MPTPNIPLDKLRAVSKTMAQIKSDREQAEMEYPDVPKNDYYYVSFEEFNTIATDLLRLAEENEKLRNNIQGCYNCGSQIHVGEKNVCEGCFKALTPATAGKPKT